MGKLSAIAERIRDTRARLEVEAEKLAVKLDAIDKAAPEAFDRGHAFLDAQKAEVADIEDTLRQLSNLPLERSPPSPGGSSPPSKPTPQISVLPGKVTEVTTLSAPHSARPIAGFETANTVALKAAE